MTWRTREQLRDESGRCAAELQTIEDREEGTAELAPKGSAWRTSRHASLRRNEGKVVLDHPLRGSRIWCRSRCVTHFVADAIECARAESKIERRLARWGAEKGLLVPGGEWKGEDDETQSATAHRWGQAEARLYEALETAWEKGLAGVNTWRGVKTPEMAEALRERSEQSGETTKTIHLPEYGEHPWSNGRAIPPSSRRFHTEALQLEQVSRWLGAFARIHAFERREAHGHPVECIERGSPEAGGLGALRLWIAVRAIHGLDRALYRYDAWAHTLEHTGRESGELLEAGRESLRMMTRVITPAASAIISANMRIVTAQFSEVGLALALQSAGAWLAAATAAGAKEGIGVCGQSVVPAKAWRRATKTHAEEEVAIAAFVFGPAEIEPR